MAGATQYMDGDIQLSDGVVQSMRVVLFMYFPEVNTVAEELSMALVHLVAQVFLIPDFELIRQT